MNGNKHVYFVRHGESRANKTKIREGSVSPLTEEGKEQARRVRDRVATFEITRIIKSPFVRTMETAGIIEESIQHVPIDISPLFVERRNPSLMLHKHMADEVTEAMWDEIAKNYHVPGWRHSDEENFEDLHQRAKDALSFIERLPEERILVVSHGLFMKMVFAHVLIGDHLEGRTFWDKFIPVKNVENTGIMHLEFTDNFHKTAKYWKLVSWNDHAHLDHDLRLRQ